MSRRQLLLARAPGPVYSPVMLLLLLACAHHAAPVAPASAPPPSAAPGDCGAALQEGVALFDADPAKASAIWEAAYARCGPGYGLLGAQAFSKMKSEKWDESADLAARELQEAGPTEGALKVLISVWPHASAATRARVQGLGVSAEKPIFVPDVDSEYTWIGYLSCDGENETALQQALIQGPRGMLDLMSFDCPKSGHHELYFDYSADPTEAEFMKELQQAEGAKTK